MNLSDVSEARMLLREICGNFEDQRHGVPPAGANLGR